MRTNGVSLDFLDGECAHIFGKIIMIVTDEPAIKEIIENKGHAGKMCCFACKNATLHRGMGFQQPLWQTNPYCKSIAETDIREFDIHDDASLRNHIIQLHSYDGVLSPGDFQSKTEIYGFNYNPYSPVLDDDLQMGVATAISYEWGHVYVCDGLLDGEFGRFMKFMNGVRGSQTRYAELGYYVGKFVLPKSRGKLEHLFTSERSKANYRNSNVSSTASELLSLAPILLRYLKHVVLPRGEALPQVNSMIVCLKVLELFQAIKTHSTKPAELGAAIKTTHRFIHCNLRQVGNKTETPLRDPFALNACAFQCVSQYFQP